MQLKTTSGYYGLTVKNAIWAGPVLLAAVCAAVVSYSPLPANWDKAPVILEAPYVDTPYLVAMPGVLAVVVTTNATNGEGSDGEHVAIVRSTDNGKTWGNPIEVEPVANPSSSWGLPYYDAANDLLYVFYAYNSKSVTMIGASSRVDCVGVLAYRTSSDKGITWSPRTELDIPTTSIDTGNITGGAHKLFWMFDVPKFRAGYLYMGLSKISNMSFASTQAFYARVAIPPVSIELLPHGATGVLANNRFGATTVTEEPTSLLHDDGLITMMARTNVGRLVEAWSEDGGKTFIIDWAMLERGATYVLNPRGPASAWKLPDGRFLLWFYDNTGSAFHSPRNPVWYRFGERVGNRIRWSAEKHMLLAASKPGALIGYASLLVIGNEILIAAGDKGTAHGGTGAKLVRFDISDLD